MLREQNHVQVQH